MFFGKPGRGLGLKLGAAVVALAARNGRRRRLPHVRGPGGCGNGSPRRGHLPGDDGAGGARRRRGAGRDRSGSIWKDCRLQTVAEPSAIQTAVCLPAGGVPDRWDISSYPSGAALRAAYEGELRNRPDTQRDTGKCNAFSWGGEREWLHGPDKPGGRIFCTRRQRRGRHMDARTPRTAHSPRHPPARTRGWKRPRRSDPLVAPLAPPHRQGAVDTHRGDPGSARTECVHTWVTLAPVSDHEVPRGHARRARRRAASHPLVGILEDG